MVDPRSDAGGGRVVAAEGEGRAGLQGAGAVEWPATDGRLRRGRVDRPGVARRDRLRAAVGRPHREDVGALGQAAVALGTGTAGEGAAVQLALETRRARATADAGKGEGGTLAVRGVRRLAGDAGVRLPHEQAEGGAIGRAG